MLLLRTTNQHCVKKERINPKEEKNLEIEMLSQINIHVHCKKGKYFTEKLFIYIRRH